MLLRLPPHVALFYVRAWWVAIRSADRFSLASITRPSDVRGLVELARGYVSVAELGTGTGWTAIALALADSRRRVISYDPVLRPERHRYVGLIDARSQARIDFRIEPAERADAERASIGFLFVDCAHDETTTRAAFENWRDAIADGGTVVFHDYGHADYPGVRRAIEGLGLRGEVRGGLFIWRNSERGS